MSNQQKKTGPPLRKLTQEEQDFVDAGYKRKTAMRKLYQKVYNQKYYQKRKEHIKNVFSQKYKKEEFRQKHLLYQSRTIPDPYREHISIMDKKFNKDLRKNTVKYECGDFTLYCSLCDVSHKFDQTKNHLYTNLHQISLKIYRENIRKASI